MKKTNRLLALLLTVVLVLSNLPITALGVEDTEVDMLEISTPEEFLEFSLMCRYDAYSEGLTVCLTSDIDMTGLGFEDIPIFLGTFDGNGHTISGIDGSLEKDGQGLFRQIAEGATVSNLSVCSTIKTEHSTIGGFVAENYGTIKNCSYYGVVSGVDTIGGFAGVNYGIISNSYVSGGVFGESQVGGIAGVNEGTILRCYNYAEINTDISDFEFTLEDQLVSNINPNSDTIDITDVGGIAGRSNGIIQNCVNQASVGYPHVGYNVGGIVGIQSGYVTGCTNIGLVQGRNEVGGIVGQFEPYVDTIYSTSKLQTLREEMEILSNLTSNFTADADGSNALVSDSFSQLGDTVDESKTQVESLLDQGEEMVNANIDAANEVSVTVADTLDSMVPISDSLDPVLDSLSDTMASMEEGVDYFGQASEELEGVADILDEMSEYFGDASDSVGDALVEIEDALYIIEQSDDLENMGEHIQDLGGHLADASEDLQEANGYLGTAMEIADEYLAELSADIAAAQDEIDNLKMALNDLSYQLDLISTALEDGDYLATMNLSGLVSAMSDVSESLSALLGELGSLENFGEASAEMFEYLGLAQASTDSALVSIELAMGNISDIGVDIEGMAQTIQTVAGYLGDAVDDLYDAKTSFDKGMDAAEELIDIFESANESVTSGLECLEDGFASLEDATTNLEITHDLISDLIDDLSEGDEIVFTKFDEEFDATRDNLSASLDQMSADMEALNENISNSADILIDDAEAINQQFALVADLIIDILQDVSAFEIQTLVEDISTMDTSDIYAGKVTDCENTGTVDGDSNAGGIAGAISFETTFDSAEDWFSDVDKTQSITQQGIAIIENSINTGDVIAKKDGAGGIVGYQDFGLVQGCTASSIVESTEGNYVGGIAGQSTGSIWSCFSKNTLLGEQFVGGIAGAGYDVQGCYSLSAVTAIEGGLGGIVGDLDTDGVLKNNYFVSDTLGGLDGISFRGQAESISYEDLLLVEGLPDVFRSMTLRFYVEDTLVETMSVDFGATISPEDFPEMSYRDGYFSYWKEVDTTAMIADLRIVGEYALLYPTLGGVKNEDGVATILVDGSFTEQEVLMVEQSGTEYTIWVEGERTAITAIRYLAPEGDVSIEQFINGSWVETEASVDGKYLIVPVDADGTVQFRVVPIEGSSRLLFFIVTILAIIVFVALIVVFKNKKKGKTTPQLCAVCEVTDAPDC